MTPETRLARALEVLEFYADPESWLSLSFQADIIRDRDVDRVHGSDFPVGGKRAREALAVLKGEGK